MNDARLSVDFISGERARDQEVFKAEAARRTAAGQTLGRPRGVLTAELAAARGEIARDTASSHGLTVERTDPSECVRPRSAEQSQCLVRLSLAAVLVLVLCLLWIRQRRMG